MFNPIDLEQLDAVQKDLLPKPYCFDCMKFAARRGLRRQSLRKSNAPALSSCMDVCIDVCGLGESTEKLIDSTMSMIGSSSRIL